MTDGTNRHQQRGVKPLRSLSPHLSVYRWGAHMMVSILHRGTGMALAFGTLILTWWLVALATGEQAYAQFMLIATHPVGQLVLFGISFAFFQHLMSGLRHLYMDKGAGYELGINSRLAKLTFVGSVILTALTWSHVYGLI